MNQVIIITIAGITMLAFILNRKANILYLLFLILYLQGLFSILDISMPLIKGLIEALIWGFFLIALFDKYTLSRQVPGVMIIIGFGIFYLISVLLSGTLNTDSYSYFRHYLNPFLLLSGVYMYSFPPEKLFRLNRFVFSLFILQIIASVVKYFWIGTVEEFAGTMIITTGSLNTIFPLFAISFMIYGWLFMGRRSRYLFFTLGFLFMGWVGDKRGIYFYIVLMLIMMFWKRFQDQRKGKFIPAPLIWWSPLILLMVIGVFYLGVRLTPSLNPEKKVWGSYDGKFLSSYIYVYNVMDETSGDYRGRLGGTYLVLREFFAGNGLMIQQDVNAKTILTGFGADKYVGDVSVRILKQQKAGINRVRGLIDTGFTQSLLATGVLGVVFLLWFYLFYIRQLIRISKLEILNPYWKTIANSTFMLGVLFLLDYFTYSSTFNTINTVYLTFFYFVGQLIKPDLLTRYNEVEPPASLI